jgi:hypothetical protein
MTGATSSSFGGSLDVTKGIRGLDVTATGRFLMTGTGSSSFSGSLDISKGIRAVAATFSGILKSTLAFIFPTSTTHSVTTAGQALVNTASDSIDFYGSAARVLKSEKCFTYQPDATSKSQIPGKRFLDAFTITSVSPVASGSNSASWNLRYGAPGSVTTNVFTLAKMASTSSYPKYTSFAASSVGDMNMLDLQISSASATVKFSVTVCGQYN